MFEKGFNMIFFSVWSHSSEDFNLYFNYKNNLDPTYYGSSRRFLEFLDVKLTFDKEYKRMLVDIFAKATNSFTYVLPNTCFPKNSTETVPKDLASRLRRICDSDDNFEKRSVQYQKCLVAKDYKTIKVKNSFLMSETFPGRKLEDLKTKQLFSFMLQNIIHYSLTLKP